MDGAGLELLCHGYLEHVCVPGGNRSPRSPSVSNGVLGWDSLDCMWDHCDLLRPHSCPTDLLDLIVEYGLEFSPFLLHLLDRFAGLDVPLLETSGELHHVGNLYEDH